MRVNTQYQNGLGLNILTRDQCDEIHYATLEVLADVGVNVFDEEALALLNKSGARVEGNRVRIPAWMVQESLVTAPCRVSVYNREGKPAMMLEKGRCYYGAGSDTPFTMDIYTGERRKSVKQDVVNFSRICEHLEHIDFVMSMALASDAPTMNSFVHQFEAMVMNTRKPIVYTAADARDLADIVAMAEAIAGGRDALASNPFIVLYDEPSSPLQHTAEAVEKLLFLAEKRLPVIYIPAVMMGATGPVTAAGAIVVANCEILSGLVIHQLKMKGAPFVYGGGVPPMDMKTQVCSYGAPEEHQNCAALITMAANYYHLPVFTTAGCTDAVVFDQQAGMEAGFNLLSSSLAGGNFIHDLGYIASGMTSSAEMLVLCDEAVGMIKHYLKGIEITPETLALDVIKSVGPGGNFIAEQHTLDHFKNHLFFPELLNRQAIDKWEEGGAKNFEQRANQKVREILERDPACSLPEDVAAKVKAIVAKRDLETN